MYAARAMAMEPSTSKLVLRWLNESGGDVEKVARYMRDTIRIGGLPACRALIRDALVTAYGVEYDAREVFAARKAWEWHFCDTETPARLARLTPNPEA